MTFLRKIRDAAKACSNIDYRGAMFLAADHLDTQISIFAHDPTEENMRYLVGKWANAARILKNMPLEGEPAPLSGAPTATVFATERLAA